MEIIIILHLCSKNFDDIIYSFIWGTVPEIRSETKFFLSFWAILCPFTSLITQKIKIFKKWKMHLAKSSFYICAPKITIIWCMLFEIRSATDIIFCHFGPFFAFLPHYWPQKLNLEKNFKKPGDIILLHMRTINDDMTHGS